MSSAPQFSPETQRLAAFMGVELPQSAQENSPQNRLVQDIFNAAVASPRGDSHPRAISDTHSVSEFPSPSQQEYAQDDEEFDALLAEVDALVGSDPLMDVPALEAPPPAAPASPKNTLKPRPKLTASSSETPSSLRDRAAPLLAFNPLVTKRAASREMPRLNPLASDVASLGSGPHDSLYSRMLSQSLLGIDNLNTYAVFGSQPKPARMPLPPKLAYLPETYDSLEAPFTPDQANYYYHLMAATPSSCPLDRLAVVIGPDLYLRDNPTGKVQILAARDEDELFSYAARELQPSAVSFTPSGRGLIVGTDEGRVERWIVPQKGMPKIAISVILSDNDAVNAVAFANDRILAGTHSGKVYEIDPRTGEIAKTWKLGNDDVCSLCVSPDGNTVAVGVDVKTVDRGVVSKLFILSPSHPKKPADSRFKLIESSFESVKASFKIAFSPDGKKVALATGRWQGRLIFIKLGKDKCEEVPIDSLYKPREAQFDEKGRYIFKNMGKTEDGRIVGRQVSGIQWLKQKKGDLIVATLETGEIAFVPLERESLRIGKALVRQVHDDSNTENPDQNARPYFNAYRNGTLYTAAPLEPVPGRSAESGVIRITAVMPPEKKNESSPLLSPHISLLR